MESIGLHWKLTLRGKNKTKQNKTKPKKQTKTNKQKRLMEESSLCTAPYGLYIKQFYIQFHPFYITNRINNTINGIFCHRLQYWIGTYGTIAYRTVIGKQLMQLIHICYVNYNRCDIPAKNLFQRTKLWTIM